MYNELSSPPFYQWISCLVLMGNKKRCRRPPPLSLAEVAFILLSHPYSQWMLLLLLLLFVSPFFYFLSFTTHHSHHHHHHHLVCLFVRIVRVYPLTTKRSCT